MLYILDQKLKKYSHLNNIHVLKIESTVPFNFTMDSLIQRISTLLALNQKFEKKKHSPFLGRF